MAVRLRPDRRAVLDRLQFGNLKSEVQTMANRTPLHDWHQAHEGRMVEFAGWDMPVQYADGVIAEHLSTRKSGGLFDICHMGRFLVSGPKALKFLEYALTNSARRLKPGLAQYTIISDHDGRPLDDAYLYRRGPEDYLLVVNASNRERDWQWLQKLNTQGAAFIDHSVDMAMIAVQGPRSEELVASLTEGEMPPRGRNQAGWVKYRGQDMFLARTGYTGEPVCFELFPPAALALSLWEELVAKGESLGVVPVGLGARDTLRLEAGLPLYGHEYGRELAVMICPTARFGVYLGEDRGDFVGRQALAAQIAELKSGEVNLVPRRVACVAALVKGMMREHSPVSLGGQNVGELTSGTHGFRPGFSRGDAPGVESYNRALGLALLDRSVESGREVEVAYRKRVLAAKVVPSFAKPGPVFLQPRVF